MFVFILIWHIRL